MCMYVPRGREIACMCICIYTYVNAGTCDISPPQTKLYVCIYARSWLHTQEFECHSFTRTCVICMKTACATIAHTYTHTFKFYMKTESNIYACIHTYTHIHIEQSHIPGERNQNGAKIVEIGAR